MSLQEKSDTQIIESVARNTFRSDSDDNRRPKRTSGVDAKFWSSTNSITADSFFGLDRWAFSPGHQVLGITSCLSLLLLSVFDSNRVLLPQGIMIQEIMEKYKFLREGNRFPGPDALQPNILFGPGRMSA